MAQPLALPRRQVNEPRIGRQVEGRLVQTVEVGGTGGDVAKPRGRRPRTHQQGPSSMILGSSAAGQLAMPAPESIRHECSQQAFVSVVYLVRSNLKTLTQ